jgi:group I intron endonuclease
VKPDKKYLVYILAFEDGKFYVGITSNLKNRLSKHKDEPSAKLKPALEAKLKFSVTVLEDGLTRNKALLLEQATSMELDSVTNGYNKFVGHLIGPNNPNYGKSMKGKNSPRYGRKHTEYTRKRMSEAKKGKRHTEVTRNKMSEAHKGKKLTESTKKKLSEALKGEKCYMYGVKLSMTEKQRLIEINSKKVMCTRTGRVFTSIKEAASYLNVDASGLAKKLKGKRRNSTTLRLLSDTEGTP